MCIAELQCLDLRLTFSEHSSTIFSSGEPVEVVIVDGADIDKRGAGQRYFHFVNANVQGKIVKLIINVIPMDCAFEVTIRAAHE